MQHQLDLGVGEHARQRRPVEVTLQRVDQLDAQAGGVVGDRELHQTQQGAVAPLAHELGVERHPPAALGLRRDLRDRVLLAHAGVGCVGIGIAW